MGAKITKTEEDDFDKTAVLERLKSNIEEHGKHLGDGIIKLNAFLNHAVDCQLMHGIGYIFADTFREFQPTKVLTVVSSGILPAQPTAYHLKLPLVYARESSSITFSKDHPILSADAVSHTKKKKTTLYVSGEFLSKGDRVLIVDDFLATGITLKALFEIVKQADAHVVGVGIPIEKKFEGAWDDFPDELKNNVPFLSLAQITSAEGDSFKYEVGINVIK